jgi:hypothetical protein
MKQPENLPNQPKSEDDVERAAREMEAENNSTEVSKSPVDKSSITIHLTKPIDQSMEKLKKRRKPRKNKKIIEEDTKNAKDKNNARGGPDTRTPPDARRGSGSGPIFPLDWFRKS